MFVERGGMVAAIFKTLAARLNVVFIANIVAIQTRMPHPATLPDNHHQVFSRKYCNHKTDHEAILLFKVYIPPRTNQGGDHLLKEEILSQLRRGF